MRDRIHALDSRTHSENRFDACCLAGDVPAPASIQGLGTLPLTSLGISSRKFLGGMMNFRDWPEEEEQGEEGADDVAFQSGAVELSRPSPSTVEFSSASGR